MQGQLIDTCHVPLIIDQSVMHLCHPGNAALNLTAQTGGGPIRLISVFDAV